MIVLTGQAESLVLAGADLAPVRPGISWLDSRASLQSAEIEAEFTAARGIPDHGAAVPHRGVARVEAAVAGPS